MVGVCGRARIDGPVLGVNKGCDVIEFIPNFPDHAGKLARNTDMLLGELKATDRYQKAMAKQAANDGD